MKPPSARHRHQLVLPIGLADHAVFANFYPGGNELTLAHVRDVAAGRAAGGWLSGAPGSGRSHLLQAACAAADNAAVYLPASLLVDAGPGLLQGLESQDLVCLDDVEALLGEAEWEAALFTLYNELLASGGRLLVAADAAPREQAIGLADLASRLSQLPVFALRPLTDADRLEALKLRALQRGLELPDDAARYLLTRARRDMGSLQALLVVLDREALREQRRLTVPFLRQVLAAADAA